MSVASSESDRDADPNSDSHAKPNALANPKSDAISVGHTFTHALTYASAHNLHRLPGAKGLSRRSSVVVPDRGQDGRH